VVKEAVDNTLRASHATISEFIQDAISLLRQHDINVEDIEGRPKSLRSISNKLQAKGDHIVRRRAPLLALQSRLVVLDSVCVGVQPVLCCVVRWIDRSTAICHHTCLTHLADGACLLAEHRQHS
jgi:hypothetical protein